MIGCTVTLTYGFDLPGDMLAKARRELDALENALWVQDDTAVGDAFFDIGIALTGVRDWLRLHPSASFQPSDVDAYFYGNPALNLFRDIASPTRRRRLTLDHARDAVAAWESFFAAHGLEVEAEAQ